MIELLLIVTPRGKPGVFIGKLDGTAFSVRATRTPMADCARSLLLVGLPRHTMLRLRHLGEPYDRLVGTIGGIVAKTSKKGRNAPVKPFKDRPAMARKVTQ